MSVKGTKLTSHQVNPANDTLSIVVDDQPGSGGANHRYVVKGVKTHRNPSGWNYPEGQNPYTLANSENAEIANHHRNLLEKDEDVLIQFQNGPIPEAGVNGLTHEVLLAILINRLEGFQSGPFANEYNGLALGYVKLAQETLLNRTRERMTRGVEGTLAK